MKDKFNNIRIEYIFLTIAIIIGISFVFITPPYQSPDETVHFFRAYQISEFQLLEVQQQDKVGGYIPNSVIETMTQVGKQGLEFHPAKKQSIDMIFSLLKTPLNKNQKTFVPYVSAATYFPLMYLPQSVGILIGRLLNLSPLMLMYLGRIFNLASSSIIIFFAIRIIPFGKRFMFLLALAPMFLFQAASVSADGVINSLSFLLISIFIRYAFDKEKKINYRDIIFIFVISILVALCKQSYFMISLLYLLIPYKKMSSKKQYYIIFILLMLSNILSILAWTYCIKYAIMPYRPNVSAVNQFLYILHDPIRYIKILGKTFSMYWSGYITQWVGRLGWLDTSLPSISIKVYISMLVLTALTDSKENIKIGLKAKLILFVSLISEIILILSLIYLSYDKVGFTYIEGVQGRYFIPLGPLFCVLFANTFYPIQGNKIKWATSIFSVLFLLLTVFILIRRYYLV